jgi:hypothetical protein
MLNRLLLTWLLSLLPPLSLHAQSVQGSLVEEGSGKPVAGTLVLLLDAEGKRQAAGLTDASGSFFLSAPAAGRYTVKAERIGYASATSSVLDLRSGESRELRLLAPAEAVVLEGISVEGRKRRCTARPETARETALLWEEARKVLNSAAWAEEVSFYRYDLARFERDLDAQSLRVESERRKPPARVRRPFESIPVGTLSKDGFVRTTPEGTFYYAPDARVLLSDEFLDHHCYRIEEGEEGLIGLAFEPVPGRRVPEIRGVLWLDRKTAELRYLEYSYLNLPVSVPTDKLGGRVEFQRLPSGTWIVERWAVRMPRITAVERTRMTAAGAAPVERRREERLAGIREVGGEITATYTRDGARVTEVPRMTVAGTVFDSARAAPLPGARVFLSGTTFSTTTDEQGNFTIAGVPEGEYLVAFWHPVLEQAEAPPAGRNVSVRAGEDAAVALAVPPLRVAAKPAPASAGGAQRDGPRTAQLEGIRVVGASEFQRRARSGSGVYITREKIEREKPQSTAELFRSVPGVQVMGSTIRLRAAGAPGPTGLSAVAVGPEIANSSAPDAVRKGRQTSSSVERCLGGPDCHTPVDEASKQKQMDSPADCVPTFYLDGNKWGPVGGELDSIRPADLLGIEVYLRSATAPGRYKRLGSDCGIILIWTRNSGADK